MHLIREIIFGYLIAKMGEYKLLYLYLSVVLFLCGDDGFDL